MLIHIVIKVSKRYVPQKRRKLWGMSLRIWKSKQHLKVQERDGQESYEYWRYNVIYLTIFYPKTILYFGSTTGFVSFSFQSYEMSVQFPCIWSAGLQSPQANFPHSGILTPFTYRHGLTLVRKINYSNLQGYQAQCSRPWRGRWSASAFLSPESHADMLYHQRVGL